MRWICEELGAETLSLRTSSEWGITGNLLAGQVNTSAVYRFLPGRTRGEGFFLAVLRKVSTSKPYARRNQKSKSLPVPSVCKGFLEDEASYVWKSENNAIIALFGQHDSAFSVLKQTVHVLYGGVVVAAQKGRDIVPTPSLALSTALRKDAFPCVDLTYPEALAYLRKEALTLSSDVPRGYVLLTFRGVPLGFVKNVGNRANNLYPSDWRIRTTHLPEGEVKVLY